MLTESNTKNLKEKETFELFGKKMSPEEYKESIGNLVRFFSLLIKIDKRNKEKNRQT